MQVDRRLLKVLSLAVVVVAALAVPSAQAKSHKHAGPTFLAPQAHYLALGDSLAFGYQQAKFNSLLPNPDPAAFNTGYVDDFSLALKKINKRTRTTNLGCPGETTDSFLGVTPCSYVSAYSLHRSYAGSQLNAAVAFLKAKANRKSTSPVTLDIGANDVLGVYNGCNSNPSPYPDSASCINGRAPAAFAHVQQNLGTILTQLRAASKKSEIIVLGLYNPLAASFLLGPSSDALAAQLNSIIAAQAAAHKARFADPLPVFNPAGANEQSTLCSLTAICTPLHDIHATDAGYQQLANVVFDASGYSRLGKKHKK